MAAVPLELEGTRAGQVGDMLLEGMSAGLEAGTDVCRLYLRERKANPDGLPDMKLANLASTTGAWMTRIGVRVMEEAFKAARQDQLGELLAALKEARKG